MLRLQIGYPVRFVFAQHVSWKLFQYKPLKLMDLQSSMNQNAPRASHVYLVTRLLPAATVYGMPMQTDVHLVVGFTNTNVDDSTIIGSWMSTIQQSVGFWMRNASDHF